MGLLDTIRAKIGMTPHTVGPSMDDAGMGSATAFTPGTPIYPFNPYGTPPRSRDFVTGYNISARPRSHERVSFSTLKGLIDSYDVAQLAIAHRVDDIRSLAVTFKAADGCGADAAEHVAYVKQVLRRPDGVLPFKAWLAKYLVDVLRYDAGVLYRKRNRRGDVTGLAVVDGTTVAPLLDGTGDQPPPPAPAYVQFAQGVPWSWLSADDIINVPFRPRSDSPYGTAPIEMVLLNANTDLRFQSFFLRRFTDGTVPEGFAVSPADWTPEQIAQFQQTWDDLLYGDEAAKHQIKWVPGGTSFQWAKDHTFDVEQAKYLERKTLTAYGVTPADMGITDDVNRSTSETQVDVQFRIGTLPLVEHVTEILNCFIADDLKRPVEIAFDTGQEKEDRLVTARANQIYIQNGVISPDEVREDVYGLPIDSERPFGRYVYGNRTGPVPVAAIDAVAGPIDPHTFAPAADAKLPHQVFAPIEGVVPAKPPEQPALAVERFGDAAAPDGDVAEVTKAETAGVTAATGIEGVDLVDDEDHPAPAVEGSGRYVTVDEARQAAALAKAELATFRRFAKGRRKAGEWRDFTFTVLPARDAHRLNDAGRALVRKANGEPIAAGLAVRAADTGRVLMLQRAFDDADDAAGAFEFPGGHIETGESPLQAAKREWQEETGLLLPEGTVTGEWVSPNGVYAGFVYTVPAEASCPILDRDQVNNPDDPDGDLIETLAWWTPEHLAGNPAIRVELAADVQLVLAALADDVAKAGGAAPKAGDPRWHAGPHRAAYDTAVTYHTERITDALTAALSADALASLARAYLTRNAKDTP